MTENPSLSEYLVLSRGQWDKDLPPETIQDPAALFDLLRS